MCRSTTNMVKLTKLTKTNNYTTIRLEQTKMILVFTPSCTIFICSLSYYLLITALIIGKWLATPTSLL